jgi:hypothetical protein
MTIGRNGAINFEAHEAWHEYCINNNKPDPWKLIRDLENEYTIYTHNDKEWRIEMNEPNDIQKARMEDLLKYRDEYMCERDVWQGQYIFDNYGYAQAEKYVDLHTRYTENEPYSIAVRQWFDNLRPCVGAERQCAFSCPVFQTCPYKAQGIYK